jgi:ABC-type glycerol-3-phosphate transport system substrate-binding protein
MRRKRMAAVMVLSAGLALAACGTGTTPQAVTPTTTPPTADTGSTLSSQTLAQVDAELSTVHADLNQANSDLNNPKPDS